MIPCPCGVIIVPFTTKLFALIFLSVVNVTPLFIVNVPILNWSSVNIVFVFIVISPPPLSTQPKLHIDLDITLFGVVLNPY